jgi:hypothetical protein
MPRPPSTRLNARLKPSVKEAKTAPAKKAKTVSVKAKTEPAKKAKAALKPSSTRSNASLQPPAKKAALKPSSTRSNASLQPPAKKAPLKPSSTCSNASLQPPAKKAKTARVSAKQSRQDAVSRQLTSINGPPLSSLAACRTLMYYIETGDVRGVLSEDFSIYDDFAYEIEYQLSMKMRMRHTPCFKWIHHEYDTDEDYVEDLRSMQERNDDYEKFKNRTDVTVRSITVAAAMKSVIKLESNISVIKIGNPLVRKLLDLLGYGRFKPLSLWFLLTLAQDGDGNILDDITKFRTGSNFTVTGYDILDLANRTMTAFKTTVLDTEFYDDMFGSPSSCTYEDPELWKIKLVVEVDKVLEFVHHLQLCHTKRYGVGVKDSGRLETMFPGLELDPAHNLMRNCPTRGWWWLFPAEYDDTGYGECLFCEIWEKVYEGLGRQTDPLWREHPKTHLCGPVGEVLRGDSKHGGKVLPRRFV